MAPREQATTLPRMRPCPLHRSLAWLVGPFLGVLLSAVGAVSTASAADEVRLLDGSVRSGAVGWVDAHQITVDGAAFALADVDRIVLGGSAPSADGRVPGSARFGVWLSDGSRLPATARAAVADRADIVLVTALGQELALPLAAVRGWGEQLPPAVAGVDRVVLLSGSYDGRVRGIKDGKLIFHSEALGELPLELGDCLALRLAGTDRPSDTLRLLAEVDPAQLPIALLPGKIPALVAAPTVALSAWPLGIPLRVEGGRRRYLSDLAPTVVEEEGAFGRTWPHRRDQALEGGPILLDSLRYAKGLSLHSRCRLRWALKGRYVRFSAVIGIADEVGLEGNCPVVITGDGRELWRKDALTGADPAQAIDLDLSGVQTLEIFVDFGERYDIGDRVTLAGAALITK